MDYLRVIRAFAEIGGAREVFRAPKQADLCVTLRLEGTESGRCHFVLDPRLARAVLRDSRAFRQDRFLDTILNDCDPSRVHWIQFFVDNSPEFLDDSSHRATRGLVVAELQRYGAVLAQLTIADLQLWILEATTWPKNQRTSRELARHLIRHLFRQLLSSRLGTSVVLDDQLLFGPDIFTPSLRLKAILCDLNERIEHFVDSYVGRDRSDLSLLLGITSLFLMAAAPVLAGLTSFFNSTLVHAYGASPWDERRYIDYSMAPTGYVARMCSHERMIEGISFLPGDRLYVFLYESTGCPFRASRILPFGHGIHRCPGAVISKSIMSHVTHACRELLAQGQFPLLSPSPLFSGSCSVFLPYKD